MPSSSRRTTSVILQCVFNPTSPYITWQPAFSSFFAQTILFSSSKRAFSSTSTDTCFPFSAAWASAAIIGEFPLTRYNVCLMASTCGSRAACLIKSTTGVNVWYGWCSRMSCSLIFSKMSSSVSISDTGCGVYGLFFRCSKPSSPYIFIKNVRSSGPGML